MGKNELHGTEISVCDTPLTNAPASSASESCIDGTLYCENGAPYIVYSADRPHKFDEKPRRYVGEIWAMRLAEDLKAPPRTSRSDCSDLTKRPFRYPP